MSSIKMWLQNGRTFIMASYSSFFVSFLGIAADIVSPEMYA